MIKRLIEWSLRNRFLVACATLLIVALGVFELRRTPVDAIPDLSENQVIVFADWTGRSPQEVEDQVTYPLSVNLQGLAGVKTVRANSMFGFSLITIIFEDDDRQLLRPHARARAAELSRRHPARGRRRRSSVRTPPASAGSISTTSTSIPRRRRTAATISASCARCRTGSSATSSTQCPGVAEVGEHRRFREAVSDRGVVARRCARLGVSLQDGHGRRSAQSNLNVGGKVIEENGMEFVVRGVGLVEDRCRSREDRAHASARARRFICSDVATVQIGGDFRRGALDVNGREVVGGIVVMRTGENAQDVIERVKEKIAQIAPSLPPGVTIKPFYDRSELIDRTIDTLKHALTEEIILVTLAHIIFLFHFRSILIVTLAAAGLDPHLVHPDEAVRHHVEHHVADRHRHRHRRAGGCGDRDDGKCHPALRSRRRRRKARAPRRAAETLATSSLAASQAGRPADLLRDGDHHPRLRAGLRAHRAGGQTLSPARVHQDLRDDRLDAARGDDRAGALHACWCAGRFIPRSDNCRHARAARASTIRRSIGRCAIARPCSPGRAAACSRASSRSACRARSRARDFRRCSGSSRAWAANSCRRSTKAACSSCRCCCRAPSLTEVKRDHGVAGSVIDADAGSRYPSPASSAAPKPPPIPRRSR